MTRITTWNVNGLRAVLQKNALDWAFAEGAPDLLLLQEIKARPDQLEAQYLERIQALYQPVWNPAERAGYSGVTSWARRQPAEVKLGIGDPEFDREGRVIATRLADLLVFNIYFPNGQRDQGRLDYKLNFYARLLELCARLHAQGERIVLAGDFNTAHQEIDLRYPKENVKTSGFMPEERAWVSRYLESGFVDAYRALYPQRVQYTWWTYRLNARQRGIGWRLDYYLVSETLLPRVREVVVHEDIYGSDHCPVSLEIETE